MQLRQDFERYLLVMLRSRPQVDLPAAYRLELLCQQQLQQEDLPEWQTFWSLGIRFFSSFRLSSDPVLGEPQASAANQVLSGVLFRSHFDPVQAPGLGDLDVINHLLFLEQADVISKRLVDDLIDWSHSPEGEMPHQAQLHASHMAQLAQDVALGGVHQVADALAAQLARLRTQRVVADIQASVSGAQEVSRLLQQFAVGNLRPPQENVLAALRGE
jgi:hypothetical protein